MKETGKFLYLDPTTAPRAEDPGMDESTEPTSPAVVLNDLIACMEDEGYAPATQLAGFLMTDDPTYLPDDAEIRTAVRHVGRDKLLGTLIEAYVDTHSSEDM